MHDAVMIYFNGEKNGGLLLIALGVVGLVAAASLLAFDLVAERRGAAYLAAVDAKAGGTVTGLK
jgi:hypothetical protein